MERPRQPLKTISGYYAVAFAVFMLPMPDRPELFAFNFDFSCQNAAHEGTI